MCFGFAFHADFRMQESFNSVFLILSCQDSFVKVAGDCVSGNIISALYAAFGTVLFLVLLVAAFLIAIRIGRTQALKKLNESG